MAGPSNLNSSAIPLIIDTSAAINLNATGCASEILLSLPFRAHITDIALGELDLDKRSGREDAKLVRDLIATGVLHEASLGSVGLAHFEDLVVGSSIETLDDGEASTIALAIEANAVAVIDERKAIRICSERFPALPLASTVDMLSHERVLAGLGQTKVAAAVFSALQGARMRVLSRHTDWVVELIGRDRAQHCSSLTRAIRSV